MKQLGLLRPKREPFPNPGQRETGLLCRVPAFHSSSATQSSFAEGATKTPATGSPILSVRRVAHAQARRATSVAQINAFKLERLAKRA